MKRFGIIFLLLWISSLCSGQEQNIFQAVQSGERDKVEEMLKADPLLVNAVACGLDPLNASNMMNGIAPAGIRGLGYVEGRCIAMMPDKLRADWKSRLEKENSISIELNYSMKGD